MPDKAQGISVRLLSIGSIICIVSGLVFGLMSLFPDEASTYGVLGLSLICVGLAMTVLALLKKQGQQPVAGQSGPVQEKG
jgi:hypothetical protein